ncbi:hypothetical protein GCM10010873_29440 [Cypionkella aquatica]|uniref:Lipoprotein n=1 Tax=Cypionkella aquatica TaxID=1756042 RepID=A0AA37U7A0_9RHOB|nr:hypothetical protein [Cypionkella aquatica]GLS87970.1 hypothetical protein GCM10010873_29440 [Cypionkella aquatica]
MIGASKILTVSYGTFSCTLEGFDEPFNTMKAIAEYFRDLAAEDRYFGAEPPTPDAAMLHRIAEREIQRRVEAKIQDNGVILRAGDADTPTIAAPAIAAPVAAPAVMPAVAAAAGLDSNGESVAARLSRLRAAQTPVAAPDVAAAVAEPSVQHIAEAAALADETYSEDQHSEDILASVTALAAAEPAGIAEQAPADLIETVAAADQPDASVLAFEDATEVEPQDLADLAALDLASADSVTPQSTDEIYTEDLVYDADLGLEDNFAQPEASALIASDALLIEETVIEDAAAEDAPALDQAQPVAEFDIESFAAADFSDAQDEATSADTTAHDPLAEAAAYADDDMLASLGALIAEDDQAQPGEAVAEPVAAQPAETLIDSGDYDDAEDDVLLANLVADLEPTNTPAVAPITPEAEANEEVAAPEATIARDAEPALPTEAGEKIQRARARVIKIRRADATPVQPQTSLLSPEAEAALQAELAALEAEIAPDTAAPQPVAVRPNRPVRNLAVRPAAVEPSNEAEDDARLSAALADDIAPAADAVAALMADTHAVESKAEPAVDPHAAAQAEARKLLETESGDDAVNRLIAATNSAMDDEDSRRRHSAISHLKAAVAATEAERQIKAANPGRPAPDRQDIYRHDLESVVRAMPADTNVESRAAANAERLSPLVLVSEQRIDRAKPATAAPPPAPAAATATARVVMPVRPRRIGGAAGMAAMQAMPQEDSLIGDDDQDDLDATAEDAGNFFADGQSFADFAEKLGANSLADLLEASAVYCAHVLGRPEFSRPFVMQQVENMIEQPDHGREDSLRAFGNLLRQGRIAKIKRGQFAITDRSPLLAEAKRIAL